MESFRKTPSGWNPSYPLQIFLLINNNNKNNSNNNNHGNDKKKKQLLKLWASRKETNFSWFKIDE